MGCLAPYNAKFHYQGAYIHMIPAAQLYDNVKMQTLPTDSGFDTSLELICPLRPPALGAYELPRVYETQNHLGRVSIFYHDA